MVAVGDAVGVILGVRVGVLVFNSTRVGSFSPPISNTYTEDASMIRKSKPLLTSVNVKGNLRS